MAIGSRSIVTQLGGIVCFNSRSPNGILHWVLVTQQGTRVVGDKYSVAVVGARPQRQGTGAYVAREFANCGCEVRAIVGTTPATIAAARQALRQRYGIACKGYLSLQALLEAEAVDAVAICSPAEAHLRDLEVAVEAGCHVFCEKPMWWSPELAARADARAEIRRRTTELVDRCAQQGRFLALNTQWPFTLEAFHQLHAQAYGKHRPVQSFAMSLSPVSSGSQMVVDAGPHLLSMLQALAGAGALHDIRAKFQQLPGLGERAGLSITCVYKHGQGDTHVEFKLTRCLELPRPAGYSINGMSVERHVELPNYMISFVNKGKRIPVRDPLTVCVEDFVRSLRTGRQPDRTSMVDGMTQLHELVVATQRRERS